MSRANLVLFTPGPVMTPAIVADYLVDPPCNYHRQPGFQRMYDENQEDLKQLLGLRDPSAWYVTILLASGTGSNEACMQTLSATGRGVIVRNGFFGQRLVDQCARNGIDHVVYDAPHDRPLDVGALDDFLAANPDLKWGWFVSHETRAGLKNPVVEIGRTLKRHGLLVGADCVSSAFAYPLDLEAAQVDLAVATTSKALMAVPGLGLVFSRHAVMASLKAASLGRNYYLDLVGEYEKQKKDHAPRFGQPVQLHAAVRAACMHLKEVGIEQHMARIRSQMEDLTAHLESLGAEALLDPRYRGNVAVNFRLPPGIEYPELSELMAREGYYILYGIIEDPSMFQVCTMGHLSQADIDGVKQAFAKVLGARRRAVA
ncbi:MAG: alanine--glyoxylate aminotransferase family protein [Kofleriaceae bacterium]|nr:alanine--glyoxylate aminotransferase family protein [Kofleriaceae bacterium]MCB9571608.1 alanine--glyoxylate aminotransferase family protein [Kofleriaceae bacterium]